MKELIGIAEQIAAKLVARKQTIAVAESSTGGLISAALLSVPGASAYFLGGGVVYTRDARRLLMDIPDEAMKGIRSASEPYAKLLAETARRRFATDWGLSETGATGPTGNRYGDAAGHSCMAVAGAATSVITLETGKQRPAGQHAGVREDGAGVAAEEFGVAASFSVSSPRKRGPITTGRCRCTRSETARFNNLILWLWVPDRRSASPRLSGTTVVVLAGSDAHRSRNARISWSCSGFIKYEITVRSPVCTKASAGMPGISLTSPRRAISSGGIETRMV